MFDRHVSGQLAAYADRQLDEQEVSRTERHLDRCGRCRGDLEQVRSGIAALDNLPVAQAPDTIWLSIEAALDQPRPARPTAGFRAWRLAWVAAALLIAAAVATYWQRGRPQALQWDVTRLEGSPRVGSRTLDATGRVGPGDSIATDGASRIQVKVGTIGSVDVAPRTTLRIVNTSPSEHRLALGSGEIYARISAPPRLFFVDTPAGTAIDLGCEYRLQCDRAGSGVLRVFTGWVSYERNGRESLVPAGAVCITRAAHGPGTPYFEDASGAFTSALAEFDFGARTPESLGTLIRESRARDTLTLWHLLSRVGTSDRPAIYERMASLSPPPAGVTRDRILALDAGALEQWKQELAWTW
jgi:hypothetical protein